MKDEVLPGSLGPVILVSHEGQRVMSTPQQGKRGKECFYVITNPLSFMNTIPLLKNKHFLSSFEGWADLVWNEKGSQLLRTGVPDNEA